MMGFRRHSIELYERARRLLARRQRQARLEPRAAGRARAHRQPSARDRPGGRGRVGRTRRVRASRPSRRLAPRRRLDGAGRLPRPAHGHPRRGGRRAGARCAHPDRATRDRLPALPATCRDPRRDRDRAHRDGARGRRRGHLGAAGRGHGRGVHPLDAGRSPAHRAARRARPRASPRDALLPRPGQPRLRQERARRHALRRLRGRAGIALDRRRALGPRGAVPAAGLRALRAAHGRRHPALPVPGRRRGDPARLPPGRDDARRQPAHRAAARAARLLGRGRPLAQRLRRRRWPGPCARRLDHDRRPGRGRRALSGLAVRGHVPRSDLGRGARARDLRRLLPAALPLRRGRRGTTEAPLAGPRPPPGRRRGLRHQGGLGAGGSRRARTPVASCGARSARVRLGTSALVRAGRRRGAGRARAGRPHRSDLLRQDLRQRPRCDDAPPARLRQRRGPSARDRRLQPAPRRARRHARRCHRHAPRPGSVPGRHGRRVPGRRPRLAARQHRARRAGRDARRRERRLGLLRAMGARGARGARRRDR